MSEAMGIVLVLVPGRTFAMGAQSASSHEPNYDPQARGDEQPVHYVALDPYFLSKYEMTQGQWSRTVGSNPSFYPAERGHAPTADGVSTAEPLGLFNPVENLTWWDCTSVLRMLGLALPTESQWEAACRGEEVGVGWLEAEWVALGRQANIADRYAAALGPSKGWTYEPWYSDGFHIHAPVGSFPPNSLGFHDMIGNVAEWCLDARPAYRDGRWKRVTGEHTHKPGSGDRRTHRGGSFERGIAEARPSYRGIGVPGGKSDDRGVRPVRQLERD